LICVKLQIRNTIKQIFILKIIFLSIIYGCFPFHDDTNRKYRSVFVTY